ncbi:hypothetical protein N6L26_02405 [Qipengyuania sp. SS22]|uniref:hypothetical protein n=1 Tax=Qipengyuania sp. SS22 TaxID=2979461 RepID=UPI0021E577F5|nr:hypothetical protein [Qipengyuania sp. SS22]UYH55440.1 hypothetical protein N6L26_02405 [Qipengyuania sp. SS22]
MTKTRHMIASAPIAIAAMAALHTPAAMAQEASPIVLDVPAPTPAASPAPIVLSAPEPAPIVIDLPEAEPLVEPPVVNDPARVATTRTTQTTPTQPRAATPEPTAGTTTTADATIAPAATADPVISAEETLAPVAPSAAQPAPTADVVPVEEPVGDTSSAALLFALLGAGGIGLAALLLFRSRRRRRSGETPAIERSIVSASPVTEREPAVTTHAAGTASAWASTSPSTATSDGAAVELPSELPSSRAERGRLLQRMITARPDRANPFASHKARAKRARLILQSIGTRFTDRKPGIDLSQYANVWPELRGWRPATT